MEIILHNGFGAAIQTKSDRILQDIDLLDEINRSAKCVVGIANGPVGLVCLYEREVWDRCIENGLTTEAKIKKSAGRFKLVSIPLMIIVVLLSVSPSHHL